MLLAVSRMQSSTIHLLTSQEQPANEPHKVGSGQVAVWCNACTPPSRGGLNAMGMLHEHACTRASPWADG